MSDARILDQGYRRYDGPRRGPVGAIRSLTWNSVQRALGMRRTIWAKLLPASAVIFAHLPAVVFVAIAAIIPKDIRDQLDVLPSYSEYYGFITAAIVLFLAIVGPEMLCPDRRHGTLGLYLASPLTRNTYLLAKVLALVPVLAMVTLGPPLLLLVGLTLADAGPASAGDFVVVLGRVVAAGVVVSAIYTALSLAVAAMTDRRAVASATVILILFTTGVTTATLVGPTQEREMVLLFNLLFVPFELVQRIYGEPGTTPGVPTDALALSLAAWTLGCALVVWWRYRQLTVTR